MLLAVAAWVSSACSGGSKDKEEEAAETDLIALVVAAFEEEPRLPSGIEVVDISSEPGWTNQNVAVLDFLLEEKGRKHHVVASVYRTERDARDELELAQTLYEAEEARSSRGSYCYWDEGAYYLDVKSAASCFGRSGVVYLEVETGPVGSDEPEASLAVLRAMQRFVEDLAEEQTERVRNVPPKPLAAILASVPPPLPQDGKRLKLPNSSEGGESARNFGLVRQVGWPSEAQDQIAAYISVFNANTGAESYKADFFGGGNTAVDGEASCAAVDQRTYRVCLRVVEETVIQAQRAPDRTTSPSLDKTLVAWLEQLAKHVSDIRAGRLPAVPDPEPTPAGTAASGTKTSGSKSGTPTRTGRTPTAVPTATPTPAPPISRINAGTWTFDMIIKSNTCGGGLLPVGSTMRAVYELTDSNGDGFIYEDEGFFIYQTVPFEQDLGGYYLSLPGGSIEHPASLNGRVGTAIVDLTFVAVNEALIDYREVYADCEIRAE